MYIICRLGVHASSFPSHQTIPGLSSLFFSMVVMERLKVSPKQPQEIRVPNGTQIETASAHPCARELAVEIPYTPPNHPPKKNFRIVHWAIQSRNLWCAVWTDMCWHFLRLLGALEPTVQCSSVPEACGASREFLSWKWLRALPHPMTSQKPSEIAG